MGFSSSASAGLEVWHEAKRNDRGVRAETGPVCGVYAQVHGRGWAFSEAASLMLRSFAPAKSWMQRQSQKRGVKKAHAILEAKIGRTVFHLWKKQVAFDAKKFLAR